MVPLRVLLPARAKARLVSLVALATILRKQKKLRSSPKRSARQTKKQRPRLRRNVKLQKKQPQSKKRRLAQKKSASAWKKKLPNASALLS